MSTFKSGETVGDYRVEGLIGQGGMGSVYRVTHMPVARQYAMKVVDNPDACAEVQILCSLQHSNIVRYYTFWRDQNRSYIIMELLEKGRTLEQLISEKAAPLSESDALRIARKMLDALQYLHKQKPPVIWRDLKPSNVMVMIDPSGSDEPRVVLIDFGIAKQAGNHTKTAIKGYGTAGYAAMEQYGNESTDTRTDLYALGATLYFLLTAKVPPEATARAGGAPLDDPRRFNESISANTWKAIRKLMAIPAVKRPQSVEEASELLFDPDSVSLPPTDHDGVISAHCVHTDQMLPGTPGTQIIEVPAQSTESPAPTSIQSGGTLLDAAIESTHSYLSFLEKNPPTKQFTVTRISETPRWKFIAGNNRYVYEFTVQGSPKTLRGTEFTYMPSDSAATLVPAAVLVASYANGKVQLAFEEETYSWKGDLCTNLSWLVRRVLQWLQEKGSLIGDRGHPQKAPEFSTEGVRTWLKSKHLFGFDPSDDQISAVANIVSGQQTYTWGPPGSGKTEAVLAAAALFLCDHGKRVLIAGPTNNAVDNAIGAVLHCNKAVGVDKSLIIRLGQPTPEFLREHPQCCEDETVYQAFKLLEDELKALEEQKDAVSKFNALKHTLEKSTNKLKKLDGQMLSSRQKVIDLDGKLRPLEADKQRLTAELRELEAARKQLGVFDKLFGRSSELSRKIASKTRERSSLVSRVEAFQDEIQKADRTQKIVEKRAKDLREDINSLETQITQARKAIEKQPTSAGNLDAIVNALEAEIRGLNEKIHHVKPTLKDKRIIGVTLDTFIGRSLRGDLVSVDWVLLDEAAYAHLAKTLPLLSLGCPLALLGDHKQLPPVCEAKDHDHVSRSYWATSSLALSEALNNPHNFVGLSKLAEPSLKTFSHGKLKDSYRFGKELACLLDVFVYRFGLTGCAAPTSIEVHEVKADAKSSRRVSRSEALEVVTIVKSLTDGAFDSIAVLTPYKNQAKHLRDLLKKEHLLDRCDVLNAHQAQGREWDVVVFSVVDGTWNAPYFTDSNKPAGQKVLNTTISRVRKQLILVLEGEYWRQKPHQMLCRMLPQRKKTG